MNEFTSTDMPAILRVAAGADCEGESRGLGISIIAFKGSASTGSVRTENTKAESILNPVIHWAMKPSAP